MKILATVFIAFAVLSSFNTYSQNKADDITGIWLTGGKEPAKIHVYKVGEKFYGKIIWLKNPTENGNQEWMEITPIKKSEVTG